MSAVKATQNRNHRARTIVLFSLKLAVTAALIAWLLRSGSLEMGKVGFLTSSAQVMLITAGTWMSVNLGLSTLRWLSILRMDGTHLGFVRGAALQAVALFFNGLLPGNLGGDFVKNHAVLGNQGARLVLLVLIERAIGVISLVWVATLGLVLHADVLTSDPGLFRLALVLVALMIMSLVGPWLLIRLLPSADQPSLSGSPSNQGRVKRVLTAQVEAASRSLRMIRRDPQGVVRAFVIAFVMHLGNMMYFLYLTRHLGNPGASVADVAMVYPLGMLSLVIPVSVSGLGVGHVMFNELFTMVGLKDGATIFHVFIVAHLGLSLVGAIPYVFLRRGHQISEPSS